MSVETLSAFLTALNTAMLFKVIFNDLHQIREELARLNDNFIAHIAKEARNG